jgi:cell filamentation protein
MYDAIEDPYTYKNSMVLVNKLDLREQAALDAFEVEISNARADEPLPDGTLDFAHYKAMHHHLFQDVYQWAGEIRTVRISKGGNPFCFPENIEGQANKLFVDLRMADYLRNLDAQTFSRKAAHFLAELNAMLSAKIATHLLRHTGRRSRTSPQHRQDGPRRNAGSHDCQL